MPVVGTLTVDLVANTATFTADLGKAGNSLDEFGQKAAQAGDTMDYSMREARGSLMLVSEEVGVHIPRHLQTLIAEIPGVGLAFAEMLPLVGVFAAIALLGELIVKGQEAKEKLAQGWDKLGITTQEVFSSLDDKMLAIGIRADELAGNHLAVLREKLLQVDRASMKELIAEFGKLDAAADGVFANLKTHWYSMHVGSDGAKHALAEFKSQYDMLILTGKTTEASDLLKGTLESAEKSLKTMQSASFVARGMGEVSKEGMESQKAWIEVLKAQLEVQQKVNDNNSGEKQNLKTEDGQQEAARQQALYEAQQKGLEQRRRAEAAFEKERLAEKKKALHEEVELEEAQARATEAIVAAEAKTQDALAKESANMQTAMARIQSSAEEQEARHRLAMRQSTEAKATAAEIQAVQRRADVELAALDRDSAQLALHGDKDRAKLQEIEDKKTQIIQKAANEQTKIREDAEAKQYADVYKAEEKMADAVAKNIAKSIVESKNMAQAFRQTGTQMLELAMENTLKMIMLGNMKQARDAAHAAASAYKWVMEDVPWPASAALAPAAGAAAFAGVMAFSGGGEVPGIGNDDSVPAMLTPGETVIDKSLTDSLKNNVGGGGHTFNFAPVIHAVDGQGVDRMLQKHSSKFEAHMVSTLRKHHKG